MFEICPKCGYQRQAANVPDTGTCAGCGLVFAKWVERQTGVTAGRARAPVRAEHDSDEASPVIRLWQRLLYVPERTDPILFWGRIALYVAFFVWGWYFILLDFRTGEIGDSFMHRINLVFHEAGHVIFMPLGNFMMTLGGSLGQLLMPIIVMVALIWKNRDSFGASIGLWWVGQSLMDLAPYINDARDLQLMLLGGGTGADRPGILDWENILLDLRLIEHDRQIAWVADALGTIFVLTALCWGAYILYLQYQKSSVLSRKYRA
jgi:hypothetical protein